jgi:hypothetical protein
MKIRPESALKMNFCINQCCRSGQFLSGSDFLKRPDPDLDLNTVNFSGKKIFAKISFLKLVHELNS